MSPSLPPPENFNHTLASKLRPVACWKEKEKVIKGLQGSLYLNVFISLRILRRQLQNEEDKNSRTD